ncbi:MAG: hypothetical protein HQM02_05100 [Magnetococcales bacterium]|nr:hypothetical protein [Magnetococcales bacterium]
MSNPLFDVFGKIVDQLFSPDSLEGYPVFVRMESSFAPGGVWGDETGEADFETLAQHAPPARLREIQNAVDTLRRHLQQEREDGRGGSGGSVTQKFKEFKDALQSGDETRLEHNPFYSVVKAVYRLNLDASTRLLQYLQSQSSLNPPKSVPFVPTLRDIWGAGNRKAGLFSKVSATLDKWLNSGKLPIEIFVFFGSTYTTARGVSDLLQMPGAIPFMNEGYGSSAAEFERNLIAYTFGLILTALILDYKARLFRCIAEAGAVFKGIGHAFLRYPRWMLVATLLTAISIKTNYDGIVSLVSKKADLDGQSFVIKQKVRKALGSPKEAKTTNPGNLHDLQLILQEAAGVATQKFLQIPKDEAGGGASSGNVGLGPRYWGKHYVIMGGYAEGTADVSSSLGNAAMAQTMDKLIRESKLDFKPSVPDKIAVLRGEYENHLKKTVDLAEAKLRQLDHLMTMQDLSWSELSRVFNLEHYEINELVKEITDALEENTRHYKSVAERMNRLTDDHVALLLALDRTGIVGETKYQIDAKAPIPNIDAIDELRKNAIPAATHKTFEELKVFLNESFGVALASSLLLVIFMIALSMDMANPMLYSRLTAVQGKKDRDALKVRLKKLKEWENDFASRCKVFFDREDLETILSGMPFPNETVIRNAYSLMLEEVDPKVKDHVHFSWGESIVQWFKSLFETTRIVDIEGYNARADAVHHLLARRELFFASFINRIFPGVMENEVLEGGSFAELIRHVEEQSNIAREQLNLEMRATTLSGAQSMEARIAEWWASRKPEKGSGVPVVVGGAKSGKLEGWFKQGKPKSSLDRLTAELEHAKREEEEEAARLSSENAQSRVVKRRSDAQDDDEEGDEGTDGELAPPPVTLARVLIYYLSQKAFMAPVSFFGYTRLVWLREIEARNRQFGEGLETLFDFIPTLKVTLGETLPRIQDETFEPLMEIWNRFPTYCAKRGVEGVEEMEQKFMEMEKRTLEIWGVSQFLGPDLDERVLSAVTNKEEIDDMARTITGGGDQSVFVEKLNQLELEMRAALEKAQKVEREAIADMRGVVNSVKATRDEINQTLLKINLRGLEIRNMPLPPQSLLRSLAQNRQEIDDAPRMASSILGRIEAILNPREPLNEKKFEELRSLEREAREILEKVREVRRSMDKPPIIDRRLEAELAAAEAARFAGERGQFPLVPSRSTFKREVSTRRNTERQAHETRVMFTGAGGAHCEGVTRDISPTGLKMLSWKPLKGFDEGENGVLRLVWDGGQERFPCQVMRLAGRELGLRLEDKQERFQSLVREELLAELQGDALAPLSLVQAETREPGGVWTAMLTKQGGGARLPSTPPFMAQPVGEEAVPVRNQSIPPEVETRQTATPRLLTWGPRDTTPEEEAVAGEMATIQPIAPAPRLLAWEPGSGSEEVEEREPLPTVVVMEPRVPTDLIVRAASPLSGVPVAPLRGGGDGEARVAGEVDGASMIHAIRERLEDAEQNLLGINLLLLDVRRSGIDDPDILRVVADCGPLLEQTPLEIDALLQELREVPERAVTRDSQEFRLLSALRSETNALLTRISEVRTRLGMTPSALPPIGEPPALRPPSPTPQPARKVMAKQRRKYAFPLPQARTHDPEPVVEVPEIVASPPVEERVLQGLMDENLRLRHELRPLRPLLSKTVLG